MTLVELWPYLREILTVLVGIGVYSLNRERKLLCDRLDAYDRRLEKAGLETSDLATHVQGMPLMLETKFLTRAEHDLMRAEYLRDRQSILERLNHPS